MRYYAVGTPFRNNRVVEIGWLWNTEIGKLAQFPERLTYEFFNQEIVKLFSSCEDAKEYLRLQQRELALLKTPSIRINPIFVIELNPTMDLSSYPLTTRIFSPFLSESDGIADDLKDKATISFRSVPTMLFKKQDIVRVDFSEKHIPSVDCQQPTPNASTKCTLL